MKFKDVSSRLKMGWREKRGREKIIWCKKSIDIVQMEKNKTLGHLRYSASKMFMSAGTFDISNILLRF